MNGKPGWPQAGVRAEEHAAREAALVRLAVIDTALHVAAGRPEGGIQVADIGCGAGVQCRLWAERGHQVYGADIDKTLIALARERAREAGLGIAFEVAPATALPWPDRSMDLCIASGLLEHVADWRACLAEFVRILKPGGALYISTTNVPCPVQNQFRLPPYPWYPGFAKRHYHDLACTSGPELACCALSPAINWFTWYGLRKHLARHGLASMDRFDMLDPARRGYAVRLLRALPPLRFALRLATPYTVLLAIKPMP